MTGSLTKISDAGVKEVDVQPPRRLSCLNRLFFTDVTSLIFLAARAKKLELKDLWATPQSVQALHDEFKWRWEQEQKKPKEKIRIRRVFFAMNRRLVLKAIFLQLIAAIGQFCGPVLLNRILRVVEVRQGSACDEPSTLGSDENLCKEWVGYMFCGILFVALIIAMLAQNAGQFIMKSVALRIRGVLITSVYLKSMKLSSIGMNDVGAGTINNLIANDSEQLLMSIFIISNVVISPIQLIVCFVLLGMYIGATFLAGMAVVILILFSAVFIMKKSMKYKIAQSKGADSRIKLTNELLSGVRIVKSYGWEEPFKQEVTRLRNEETRQLRTQMYMRCFLVVVIICAPLLLATTTFSTYAAAGGSLTPSKVFTAFAIMNLMRFPMAFLPFAMIELIKVVVAFGRLQTMLQAEEQTPAARGGDKVLEVVDAEFGYLHAKETPGDKGKGKGKGCFGRCLAKFAKGKGKGKGKESGKGDGKGKEEEVDESALVELKQDNGTVLKMRRVLTIDRFAPTPGGLTMVVGPVGCGKTTLLAAMLGEAEILKGSPVELPEFVGYAAQIPWITNATLEQNIKFGASDRGEEWYHTVLDAACLNDDIDLLPAGDQTEIGERGVNLSGGQKARVALARAIYRDSGLYIFDDPLAAVDAHVGKKMFQKVMGKRGMLAGKTRILVTHQVQYVPQADQVVMVENGRISAAGSYEDLIAQGVTIDGVDGAPVDIVDDELKEAEADKESTKPKSIGLVGGITKRTTIGQEKDGELVAEEKSVEGAVGFKTYLQYFGPHGFTPSAAGLLLVGVLFNIGARLASDFWLAIWSDNKIEEELGLNLAQIILVYFGIALCQALFTYIRSLAVMALGCVRASRNLYRYLYQSVFRTKPVFFDVTPTGRILNRFTADIDIVDNGLPGILGQTTGTLELLFASLVGILIANQYAIIVIIPCVIGYCFLVGKYRHFARDIQRLESVSKSPIFNRISETLNGLATVRAGGYQWLLETQSFCDINTNQACTRMRERSQVWLVMRLEMLSCLISTASAVLPLLPFQIEGARASFVGVALIHSLELSKFIQSITQMLAQLEQKFTSVERIFEYCELDSEAAVAQPADKALPAGWPLKGAIEFSNVSMRYREELDPALRGLSFFVKGGEKLGVVGRTGSGKSSIIVALLRLTEKDGGTISIDGQDLSQLGLQVLRTSLSMIPQDPVLFGNTTLRLNLDPFQQHTDAVLLDALAKVQMNADSVLTDGLDTKVGESGGGFSVGQRQLLCLARAVLRHSRVILLDEATASVDGETDTLIQKTIRDTFSDSTVFCIAHRIRTILDSDRVMVMNQGVCQELGTPQELLAAEKSHLRALAMESGIEVPVCDMPVYQFADGMEPINI